MLHFAWSLFCSDLRLAFGNFTQLKFDKLISDRKCLFINVNYKVRYFAKKNMILRSKSGITAVTVVSHKCYLSIQKTDL